MVAALAMGRRGSDIVDVILRTRAQHETPGVRLNHLSSNGETPLHAAARGGNVTVVGRLVDEGAVLEARNSAGATPYLIALAYGHAGVARELSRRGARCQVRDAAGRGALHYADNVDTLAAALAGLGGDVDVNASCGSLPGTPLYAAIRADHIDVAAALLHLGARVTPPDVAATCTSELHVCRSAAAVDLLMAAGASLECPCSLGAVTPLAFAIVSRQCEVAKALLRHGANPNARLPDGRPIVCFADTSTLGALVRAGVDVNARDDDGRGIVFRAAREGGDSVNLLKRLAHVGADFGAPDRWGLTPALTALCCGRIPELRVLLRCGAQLDGHVDPASGAPWLPPGNGSRAFVMEGIEFAARHGATDAMLELVASATFDAARRRGRDHEHAAAWGRALHRLAHPPPAPPAPPPPAPPGGLFGGLFAAFAGGGFGGFQERPNPLRHVAREPIARVIAAAFASRYGAAAWHRRRHSVVMAWLGLE